MGIFGSKRRFRIFHWIIEFGEYEQKNIELEQVYQSKGWKTLEKLRNVKGKFKK